MKLFSRKPKKPSAFQQAIDEIDAHPGGWFPYPDNLAMGRDAFLRYDVVSTKDAGVWIRRRPNV